MTFRLRVVIATSIAVSLAIALACAGAFVFARHAVLQSVDDSLLHTAQRVVLVPQGGGGDEEQVHGSAFELVFADGTQLPASAFRVNATVLAVARGRAPQQFINVTTRQNTYRELVIPVAQGTTMLCPNGECVLQQSAAEVFSADITGQRHQLSVLATTLLLLALGGILLAALLGYLAAHAALRPLERVTDDIEAIAKTNEIERRLDDAGVDELGRLRRAFNGLLSSVDRSQRLQRQLVMDASHELRTPLTSLRTNAQVLHNLDKLSADDRTLLVNDMILQVDELAALVTDLGELARGERSEGEPEQLRLDELLEEVVATARTHARTKNVTIDLTTSPSDVNVRRARVVRAISNLLNNAIKFAPVDGRILVTSSNGAVTVADNGPGVPENEMQYVFDRFWRSPSARSMPGSGLGLAIVTQVAHEAGGSASVRRSEELGGAEFTLQLPVSHTEGK